MQETAMKKQKFHIGSFLIGLLVGGVLLILVAMLLPLRTGTQTIQSLHITSRQFNASSTNSLEKTWSKLRSEISIDRQKVVGAVNQIFNKDFHGIVATVHNPSLQPCTWLDWLDRQFVHLTSLVGIHARVWTPSFCTSK
jgi:hypothetical protein